MFFRWQEYGAYIGVTLSVYMYNIYSYMICRKIKDIPKTSIPKVRCLEKAPFIAERSALQGGLALALGVAMMDSVPASQFSCTKTSRLVVRSSQTALMCPASLGSLLNVLLYLISPKKITAASRLSYVTCRHWPPRFCAILFRGW